MRDLQYSLVTGLASRYKVLGELGRGGMAVVFSARDLKHDRDVALKVLRPELAVAVGRDRFAREIRLAAQLAHPNILPLHDSGEVDGYLYYVTPLVSDGTLRDRLEAEGQLPIHEAVAIGVAIARALEHAHRHGIVHRDIKPDNIMLQGGAPVVADFGIGKAVDVRDMEDLTQTGLVLGSAAYLSPEQGAGDPQIDGRTDIYSLGCVMYEMLAGEGAIFRTDISISCR